MNNISFICSGCLSGSPLITGIQTGSFFQTEYQEWSFHKHCVSMPGRYVHGVFLSTDTGNYLSIVEGFKEGSFAGFQANGHVNLYKVFDRWISEIELSGAKVGKTSTGQMALADLPDYRHPFGCTGYGAQSGICSHCGSGIF